MAKTLKKKFDAQFKNANSNFEKALVEYRANIDNCSICGSSKESFEPPVYYCNGRCGGQRIKRNAVYYTNNNNTYHW